MTGRPEDAEIIRESKERIYPVGKIIAVVGAAGSGKSTLARELIKHYRGIELPEFEAGIPERIQENFKNRTNLLETILWFRNQQIRRMHKAVELRNAGRYVFMDTFWLTNQLHIAPYLKDDFERKVALEMAELDRQTQPWPDVIVYVSYPKEVLKSYMAEQQKERPWLGDENFLNLMFAVREEHEKYFAQNPPASLVVLRMNKVREIDFETAEGLEKVADLIDEKIQEEKKTSS